MKKHVFSFEKQYFSQNHHLAKNTIFLSILSSFLVPFSFKFGIVFGYIFGIDFRMVFLATFFNFWCHFRRPRGPTGDLRGTISAPKRFQKGTSPKSGEPLRTVRLTIFHSKCSVDRFFRFLVDFKFHFHKKRRTCNVQRPIFYVFFSFVLDSSSHFGSIFCIFLTCFCIGFSSYIVLAMVLNRYSITCSLFVLFILLSSILTYHKPDN